LFFGAAFFCAELFFFVGLFFLGATLLFDIRLVFALVNYLRMEAGFLFLFSHVVQYVYKDMLIMSEMIFSVKVSRPGI
jgi:hypothetical protein